MQKNELYKNYRDRRRLLSRSRQSGQALTEYVLILSVLGATVCLLLSRLAPGTIAQALTNNVEPLVDHAVEDKY